MSTLEYIKTKRLKGPLHFTLIDPDKQEPEAAGELAKAVEGFGSDAIMIGGSWGDAFGEKLEKTISEIKKSCKLPVILFPSSAQQISEKADAIFFMSLLNSRSPQFLIDEQAKGAIYVKKFGLEPLSTAYMIVESGNNPAVAWVGDVKAIPRDKPEIAVAYSLAAKYFGMKLAYLEGGSGAKLSVPAEMVSAVKQSIGPDMWLIVGGGIRDAETAKEKIKAGADIIVTGTIAEENKEKLKEIIKAIKE
ncbi:MAG TPA: geranylgeranylglyceryl/heptaprenylglyceryl phosphate synthase [archaeon]|nr:geranylgeranylglyceryl/heptaprenylglyceryl phosphate synthase [archaeon]